MLMTTDPGDLVVDPTCGSLAPPPTSPSSGAAAGSPSTPSRVALALARARIMGARYPYHLLSDSREGQLKQAEVERRAPPESPTYGDIRQGFVYERVPHITLRAIANNTEIDVIWEAAQEDLEPLREGLNRLRLACRGKNGRSPAMRTRLGRTRQRGFTPNGGSGASPARSRSTLPSPPKPTTNISTTGPTRTGTRCALPDRSPSRASPPTERWRWTRTAILSTGLRSKGWRTVKGMTSPRPSWRT